MPYITINNIRFYYEIRGNGPPMMMIMGLAANSDWWPEKLLSLLESHYTLILFDNRGAGRTESSKGCYRIEQFAEDAIGLMDALDVRKAHVFGVSMGGMIAQEMAISYPDRIDRLILGCTTCGPKYGRQFSMQGVWYGFLYFFQYPLSLNRWLISLTLSQYNVNTPENQDFLNRIKIAPISSLDKWKQIFASLRHNSYPRLKKITSPVLLMAGENDFLIPPKNSDILARQIPQARLITFPNASHAFLGDETEAVFLAIRNFIAA